MYKTNLVLLIFILATTHAVSQEQTNSLYRNKSIYLEPGAFASHIVQGNKKYRYDERLLLTFMAGSPEAVAELKKYEKKSKTGIYVLLAGFAGILVPVFIPDQTEQTVLLLMIPGAIVYYIGYYMLQSAQKHEHKAIWLYNLSLVKQTENRSSPLQETELKN